MKKHRTIIIALLSIAIFISALVINIEMYKDSRLGVETQAFYEIKGDYCFWSIIF